MTVISLQPGEELVTVAAGDTVRWIGRYVQRQRCRPARQCAGQPIRSGLKTNLVITTNRRTYLLELASTEKTWMASASGVSARPDAGLAAPGAGGQRSRAGGFRLVREPALPLRGQRCNPSWKPLRAFDDGAKVYIQFPSASRKASCRRCS
ncbi:TrbG/VirB9 family P-type conjugative transfer protein [Serratia marcescens]|uniref:TrbG/VirB9 family P-type conjugative transfer protein n=1 Tax=Serratia marcescens TaxID=615 RepID=A0A939NT28_SERMA|nr:TrbG/VirB9 family P-type conjugative transfer protein [Serratia marcescens]